MLSAGLRNVFPYVIRDPITEFNTLLVASERRAHRRARCATRCPTSIRACARCSRRPPAAWLRRSTGGEVYTDDRAPVEWLIDRSIVSYAARE